jgi:hypothetical protein
VTFLLNKAQLTRAQLFRALLSILGVSLGAYAPPARAQPEGTMPAQQADAASSGSQGALPAGYESAADLGFKEFSLRNYPEARKRFLEAADIFPNARISRALGMVEYELRHYQAACDHLSRALTESVRPLSEAEHETTQQLLASAQSYLAHYRLEVQPRAASLRLDGSPLLPEPDGTVVLQAGDHVVEADHAGFWPVRRELHVRGGETQTVELQMLQRTPEDKPTPLYANPWVWVGSGVVAAGVAVALVFVLRPAPETRVGEPVTTSNSPPGIVISALGSP